MRSLPPEFISPLMPGAGRRVVRWGRLHGSAASLALLTAARAHAGPLLVVTGNALQADRISQELEFFSAGEFPVLEFPDWETLPYDAFSPHQDIVSRRLESLSRIGDLDRGFVVIAMGTLLQRLPPRAYVGQGTQQFSVGDRVDLADLTRRLDAAGYVRVPQVEEHGEFAVRGSLLDLYPMGSESPCRLDLLDDEIESLRRFDPDTQRTLDLYDSITLLPAREFPLTPAAIRGFRQRYRARFEGDPTRSRIYRDVSQGLAPGGIEYYLPLFFDSTNLMFDYLPPSTLIAALEDPHAAAAEAWAVVEERYEEHRANAERPLLQPAEVFCPAADLRVLLQAHARIEVSRFELEPTTQTVPHVNFPTVAAPSVRIDARAEDPAENFKRWLDGFAGRVLLLAESQGRREMLLDILRRNGAVIPVCRGWPEFVAGRDSLAIAVAPIENGLLLEAPGLAVLAEKQLFGDRVRARRRRRQTRDPEKLINNLKDLQVNSPVVHEEYGIGRYQGLKTLDVGGLHTEFLTLEYAGGDRLYVPVHALQLVTRYAGGPPETAPLHRLGSDQWRKARGRAARRIRDVAAELLDIYSRRAARTGLSYRLDELDYRSFAAEFPFEPTPDQAGAIDSVVDDMTSLAPMDRLVCGDVGFGKTEVALRAAFIAVYGGKQVALLVPTTLLAQQHFQTFQDRFADWPVRVEVLSRFRSPRQSAEIREGLAAGTVDIVIGTHKLLHGSLKIRDLGLVIIDEEHRFGVRHKERLKSMRAEVDILTLTATPIPRTLNMALGGIRDMSLIATPPEERLAIKTFVTEWNEVLIREAILREIKRGGQVYFVHNEVKSIDEMAARMAQLVPEATFEVGHGQMRERHLEQVMLDFYHRRFNVLVCSTIIESGLDVPTANTILINRADRFGLAQLHQLRGRVGRSHHQAYAYLIAPPAPRMTADALKRLEAIESLEALGSGFTLASHDLEIRGAGELLGEEQSGQIAEIGFALYAELLERAVAALKSGHEPDLGRPLDHGPEVNFRVTALLPDDYLPDVHLRLVIYKRLAGAPDNTSLRELQVEMIDRFGLLPPETRTLVRLTELKLKAAPLGIVKIEAAAGGGYIEFRTDTRVDPALLVHLIQEQPDCFSLDGQTRFRFRAPLVDAKERFSFIEALLDKLSRIPPLEAATR